MSDIFCLCKVQYNDDDSMALTDDAVDEEEKVVMLPSKMVINIFSSEILEMTITKTCLEVLTNLGKVLFALHVLLLNYLCWQIIQKVVHILLTHPCGWGWVCLSSACVISFFIQ